MALLNQLDVSETDPLCTPISPARMRYLPKRINQAFVDVTDDYSPLTDSVCVPVEDYEPISVDTKFGEVSTCLVGGWDEIPVWVLKEYVYILDTPIADILNTSFSECRVPSIWNLANVPLLPKVPTIHDLTKNQRLISLTLTVPKIAEDFVIDSALNPVGC